MFEIVLYRIVRHSTSKFSLQLIIISTNLPPVPYGGVGWLLESFQKNFCLNPGKGSCVIGRN